MNRLKEFRQKRGFSQYWLGRAIGKYQNRIWQLENGYAEPKDWEKEVLATVLGVPAQELFPPAEQEPLESQPQAHKAPIEKAKSLGWTPPEGPAGGHSSGTQG